jgi:DNA repair protein RadC
VKRNEKNGLMGIKSWAEEDRPREKLIMKGANVLSDAELLAVLIGSGNSKESAVTLSQKILLRYENDLNLLARATTKELISAFNGIGEAKAVSIVAALELGRRRQGVPVRKMKPIQSSADLYDFFAPIADLLHEEFWVAMLNKSNRVVSSQRVGQGGFDSTAVDVRMLIKIALENSASAIAVCHNHPSGSLTPSKQDIAVTQKIKNACALMDIRFLDHLIVTGNEYFSFVDKGML